MSLSTTARRIQYTLASTNQALSFPYYFLANSDLVVVKTNPTTYVDTTLTITTHYTVSGAGVGAGGTVTMVGATVGDIITIYGGMPQTQPTSLPYQGQFPSAAQEQAYDRVTMLLQQLRTEMDRTVRVPVSNAALDPLTRPARTSTVLTFDANGVPALASIDSAGTGATNNLVTATGSTTTRTLGSRFGEVVNVMDFGASNEGVLDATTGIQAAIDAAKAGYAADGLPRCVFLPAGKYKVSATLVNGTTGSPSNGVSIIGAGMASSVLVRSTDYGDTLRVCGSYLGGNNVQGLGFVATGTVTSGAHLVYRQVAHSVVSDIFMQDGFGGIDAIGLFHVTFDRLSIVGGDNLAGLETAGSYFFRVATNGGPEYPTFDTLVSNFLFRSTGATPKKIQYGIDVQQSDGIWFQQGHVIGADRQCNIAPPSTYLAQNVIFRNVFFDGLCRSHLSLAGAGTINAARFDTCIFGGADGTDSSPSAAVNNPSSRGIYFRNCEWGACVSGAVSLVAGTYIDLKGCSFIDCASDTTSRVVNVSSGCSFVSINDNTFGTSTTTGGALFLNGATDLLVDGNRFSEVTGDDIIINVMGARTTFADNSSSKSDTAIASAATPAIPACGEFFLISGTTTITDLPTPQPLGRKLTLYFQGALTVTHGAALKLTGAANMVTTAGTTLNLRYNNGIWYEEARSIK